MRERDDDERTRPRPLRVARSGTLVAAFAFAAGAALAGEGDREQPAQPPQVTREVPPVVAQEVQPAELPEDPSSFTTVIRVDDYRDEVTSVEELLGRTPGVQVRRFGGEGQPAEISIRGSTPSQVVVQLDGVRLNNAQTGGVDLSTIPLSMLERIEVSRGGGSVQAGSAAIGGVVNLETRRPGGPRRSEVSFTAGSFDSYRGSAFTAGTAPGDLEYALAYDGFGSEGDWTFRRPLLDVGGIVIEPDPPTAERINNQVETQSGLLALGHDLGDRAHVTLRDQLFYSSRGQPGLDSGSVGNAGQRENAHERHTRNTLGTTLEGADLSPASLDATLDFWHRYDRVRFRDPDVVPSLGSTIDTEDTNQELGSRLNLGRTFALYGTTQRPSLVLEGARDTLASNTFDDQGRNAFGVMLQDDASAFEDTLRLIPALRWEDTEGFGAQWLPRIGGIVTPLPWLRFQGNLERSFRVPNFDELFFPDRGFIRGNPALRPEEATNADIGGKVAAARLGPVTDAFFEAAYFHNDIRDSIVFLLVSPSLVEPRNTGPATIDGCEITGGFRVLQWVGLSANYTHLHARVDRSGAPLPGRADDETNVRVELGPPARTVLLVGEMQITSEIPVSDSGNTVLPARTVYNAAISVDLARLGWLPPQLPARSLLVTLEGKNLTDQTVRDAQFFPQPGRTLEFRVDTQW